MPNYIYKKNVFQFLGDSDGDQENASSTKQRLELDVFDKEPNSNNEDMRTI